MKKIQVFDPALCCSSGVCGVDVDPALVAFSADLDWARQQGALIERFNLAQQPMAFADHAVVKAALEREGEAALPLVLVDGQMVLSGRYPTRGELAMALGPAGANASTVPKRASIKLAAIAVAAAPASSCCGPAPAAGAVSGASKCC